MAAPTSNRDRKHFPLFPAAAVPRGGFVSFSLSVIFRLSFFFFSFPSPIHFLSVSESRLPGSLENDPDRRSQVQGDEHLRDGFIMLREILLVVFCCYGATVVKAIECDPSRYICAGECPPLPEGVEPPTTEAICSKDPDSETCICWLHNPSSQLHTLFQCEARINGSVSKIACIPPSHCFLPDPNLACLIVLRCNCLLFETKYESQKYHSWKRVKAIVHTMRKQDPKKKIQGDVREFSLKHLLFLLGFVIAPLLCWCLLNFFHEGKCRKKPPPQPPEAQPIPTARTSTIDNMNNEDGDCQNTDNVSGDPVSSRSRPTSVQSQTFSIQLPSAPEDVEAVLQTETQQQTLLKCESPPPYCESADRNFQVDYGPPPTYEDAVRGTDTNVQQLWQTVFIVDPVVRENV
ncbi:uncharacterized protein NPIL_683351 [Nephila pilipes]|uniref:Transmembrane protein n=1 Tax=Nephila pilipes TaxID=299642 RepID=A0A8X6QLT6_NEPPI|nr:uncharacterized protein NPIL_683351 [Nephila pilipes]